jgi:hypothetical protein
MVKQPITPTIFSRICRLVATGKSLRGALKGKGMPSLGKFFRVLEQQPAWAEQYARARQAGIEHHIDGIIDMADSATPENAHAVRLKVDTRKWIASKILPRIYGDRQQIDISDSREDWGDRLRRARERVAEFEVQRVVAEQPPQVAQLEALPAPAELPTIANDAEYEALPSGSVFIDPEGEERTKP